MNRSASENMEYRKLKPEESGKYRLIRLESLQKYPHSFGSKYEIESQKTKLAFEKFIEESNPDCLIVGALIIDKLIGICGFYRLQGQYTKHRGEIIQMYVQPEYQGKSVGYDLLKATGSIGFQLENIEQIELEVMTDIKAANRIYEKVGFEECGIQRKFYKKEENYLDQRLMILYRDDNNSIK